MKKIQIILGIAILLGFSCTKSELIQLPSQEDPLRSEESLNTNSNLDFDSKESKRFKVSDSTGNELLSIGATVASAPVGWVALVADYTSVHFWSLDGDLIEVYSYSGGPNTLPTGTVNKCVRKWDSNGTDQVTRCVYPGNECWIDGVAAGAPIVIICC